MSVVRGSDLGCTLKGQGKGPRVLNRGRTGSDLATCLRPLCRDRLKLLGQMTCMLTTSVILGRVRFYHWPLGLFLKPFSQRTGHMEGLCKATFQVLFGFGGGAGWVKIGESFSL